MDAGDLEIELKFIIAPDQIRGVLAWLGLGRRPTPRTLDATYFDTAGRDLRQAGWSLRVRAEDGRLVQTLKSRADSRGRLGRGEWSTPTAGPDPDLDAVRRTPAAALFAANPGLMAVFTAQVTRQSLILRTPEAVIEACLDDGRIRAGGRVAPVAELELELKSGPTFALFDLARRLQETFPARLSTVTKSDRGYALADGGPLAPRHFETPPLDADMTAGVAFRAMARAALDQIVWNAALIGEAVEQAEMGPEAVHQTRVGIRRLRASLSAFKSIVDDDSRGAIVARLKSLAAALDTARNLDVFLAGAWRRAGNGGAPVLALETARASAYDGAVAAFGGPAGRAFPVDALAWIETGPWTSKDAPGARERDRPATHLAARVLDRGQRRLIADGAHLARLSPAARHAVRIQAKSLRYAADGFHQLFPAHPKRAERFLAALASLADTLGDLNDIDSARSVARNVPGAAAVLSGETARERRLTARAERAFKALRAAKPFWT